MKQFGKTRLGLLILLLCVLFCACDAADKNNAEGKKGEKDFPFQDGETLVLKDHMLQGNLAEISLYTRENDQQVTVTIPMIADTCFSSVEMDQSLWSFGDSEIVSTYCSMEEEYGGYYIYLLIIGMTYPTVECTMTSLPLLIDGQHAAYEFGTFCVQNYGKTFYSSSGEEDLYYRDNVFEVPDSTLNTVPFFNMVAEKRTEIKSICISSKELSVSEEKMEDVLGIHEAGEEFPVEMQLENTRDPRYYCFETVVEYLSASGEEVAIPSMCTTRSAPKLVAKAIVDEIK